MNQTQLPFCSFSFVKGVCVVLGLSVAQSAAVAAEAEFVFCCRAENDLYRLLSTDRAAYPRFDNPAKVIQEAAEGAAVLFLADDYPQKTIRLEQAIFDEASRKRLRLYVEYPAYLPSLLVGPPKQAKLERAVVMSEFFGSALPPMRIASINDCHYVPLHVEKPHLVLAKVAGVDEAIFGLKDTPYEPLLFEHPRGDLLVATTKLSHFVTGRYMPDKAWCIIWQRIFEYLQPHSRPPKPAWTPSVRPTFTRDEPLPEDVEQQALRRSADWIIQSRTLRHPQWPKQALDWALTYNTVREKPAADWPRGDGSLGITEGYSSIIYYDGSQPMRYAVRADCNCEAAMLLAFDAAVNCRAEHGKIAENLVDYIFFKSGLVGGRRDDPTHPAHGLIGWALDNPNKYYEHDNSRVMLSVLVVSAIQKQARWDEPLLRCLLANLRTTGPHGFRRKHLWEDDLKNNGWQHYWSDRSGNYPPMWLWACSFWAYDKTKFEPLRRRSEAGLRRLMAEFYQSEEMRADSIALAEMLLPLAWLVRVDDKPEYRRWLKQAVLALAALQDSSGAIRATTGVGWQAPTSTADYGSREMPIVQRNNEPICDLLYSCNFAFIGLHEAVTATGEPLYAEIEKKLAEFLCRVQIRATDHPELDGAWYRAFNFRNWDYWASNGDWEWGAWCLETGWTQPWIAAALALRQMNTSLWELTKAGKINDCFDRVRREMLPNEVLQENDSSSTKGP